MGAVTSTSAAALVWQFALQAVAGWYLNRAYIPDPKFAHGTMEAIMEATPHSIVAGFHYWGGFFFLAHSLIHLALMMFSGMFKPPNHWRWFLAILFVACAFLFQVTGTLLPFDRHGVQSASIEGGIMASAPGGEHLAGILMGGSPAFNGNTLPTWYFAHKFIIPIALLLGIVASVGTWFRREGGRTYGIVAILVSLIPLAMAYANARPLGTEATAADYNQFGAVVGWYSWPLHGSLTAFNQLHPDLGWVGSAVVPLLFFVFLLAAPALSSKLASAGIQLLFVSFVGYFLIVGMLFGGVPAPLTGTRDPASPLPSEPVNEPSVIDVALAEKGRQAFNNGPCFGCHGFNGEDPSGGPNLKGIGARQSDAAWFMEFVRDPKSKKPGTTMPGFPNLDQKTSRSLAEFLRSRR